ncbi:hypothetical protein C048_02521 [Brucella melitensis UK19/04]|nr:hypothetical protein C048_02521 [Brucella melitensis UK19/04]ENS54786.1 hypothetical protein C036_02964 [Brucella melitensis F1/06 B10]ENS68226.1 hypothetical protein C034_02241 [Brucella melitensis UK14/06]ENS70426.1 hypothetical protein C060_02993 [Brucella melitensis UK22/04]ENS73301.1 hypothetical protein C059_02510 [Brucella melitensis UK23/06]ENS78044.1 hypothetical protein C047_02518 [Brucella melitensis Uk24/06]
MNAVNMHEPGLSASRQSGNLFAPLQFLYLIAMLFVLAGILTAAMVLQYGAGEVPCPLCLLQRMAMFGVCFGVMLQLRYGPSFRFSGIGLLFAIVLLIISVRQTLLDIYPRPGHEYIGSTVFGLHMPRVVDPDCARADCGLCGTDDGLGRASWSDNCANKEPSGHQWSWHYTGSLCAGGCNDQHGFSLCAMRCRPMPYDGLCPAGLSGEMKRDKQFSQPAIRFSRISKWQPV